MPLSAHISCSRQSTPQPPRVHTRGVMIQDHKCPRMVLKRSQRSRSHPGRLVQLRRTYLVTTRITGCHSQFRNRTRSWHVRERSRRARGASGLPIYSKPITRRESLKDQHLRSSAAAGNHGAITTNVRQGCGSTGCNWSLSAGSNCWPSFGVNN